MQEIEWWSNKQIQISVLPFNFRDFFRVKSILAQKNIITTTTFMQEIEWWSNINK